MKQVHESFSALMDNEADEFDLRRALKTLGTSPQESDTWRRYHLARSMMRRERDAIVDIDISGDVMAALADEPRPVAEPASEPVRRHSFSMMGGAAVAAAVSLMVITGVQVYNGRFGGDTTTSSDVAAATGTSAVNESARASLASGSVADDQSGAMQASMQAPVSSGLPYSLGSGSFGGGSLGAGNNSGLMTVGEQVMQPMFLSSSTRQSPNVDMEQAQTLQSYLERHSVGAAYSTGDNWMPLLRTPGALSAQVDRVGATEAR
ncbi:sigma-E factor negative regulatory protein [Salinicola salarius]|uniref:sigma-E factor negative regulatory protein n=1 Tax=Salinicola salarius TaxID=430457 RepID=UPI000DA11BE5|nr:sigma-E factor negative regulatory protein [Salinicola salarius]MDF3917632.1 sigma-E factor negative regulatory protein [Salinicola salarius]